MTFLWPTFLWALALIPIFVLLYILAQKRRQKYALRFSTLTLVRQALGKGPGFRRHIPAILLLTAVAVLTFALSRPTASVPLLQNGGLIVLVLDISGSMRAQDVTPSRIEAAQAAARTFIDKQPSGSRIALVAFAATASLVQVPTDDKDLLKAAIDRLALQRGTAIGSGIVMAMNTILEDVGEPPLPFNFGAGQGPWGPGDEGNFNNPQSQSPAPALPATPGPPLESQVVILLSDGRSNVGPDPLEVVPLAAQRRVRIYTVGLGDPQGVVLQAYNRRARVTLDEPTLQAIADKTKADYYRAGSDTDLQAIYGNLGSSLVIKQEKLELTVLLAGLAVVLLLTSAGLSLWWFNRVV